MIRTTMGALLAGALLLTTACGDGVLEPGPGKTTVATVEVGPAGRALAVGDTLRVEAVARAADGTPVGGVALSWASEQGTVAEVVPAGATALVRALRPGTASIRAAAGGTVGRVTVTVNPAPARVDTVVLHGLAPAGEPQTTLMEVGWEHVVGADARVPDGSSVTKPFTWGSDDPAVATVAPQGEGGGFAVIRGQGPGRTRVWAETEGRRGSALVVVAPATPPASAVALQPDSLLMELGKQPELWAWVYAEDGAWVENPQVTWFSHDTTIVRVEGRAAGRGRLTGLREGRARVTALSGGRSATAMIRVKVAGPVGSVAVTPRELGVWTGQLFSLAAHVAGTGGGDLPGQPVTWSVEDPSVVEIDAVGRGRALRPGSTRVFAESGGKKGAAFLRVLDWPQGPTTLALLPNVEPGGGPRVTVTVGERPWVDAGVTRTARLWLTGGTLTLDAGAARYEQALQVDWVLIDEAGTSRVVRRETWTDRGEVFFDPFGTSGYAFRSTAKPGFTFDGIWVEGGLLALRQVVGTAPAVGYLYRM